MKISRKFQQFITAIMNQFNVQFARLKKSAQKWIDAPLPTAQKSQNNVPSPQKKSPVNVYNQDKIVAVGVNVPKCSLSYVDNENGNVFDQDIEEEIRLYEQALDRIRIRFVQLKTRFIKYYHIFEIKI